MTWAVMCATVISRLARGGNNHRDGPRRIPPRPRDARYGLERGTARCGNSRRRGFIFVLPLGPDDISGTFVRKNSKWLLPGKAAATPDMPDHLRLPPNRHRVCTAAVQYMLVCAGARRNPRTATKCGAELSD